MLCKGRGNVRAGPREEGIRSPDPKHRKAFIAKFLVLSLQVQVAVCVSDTGIPFPVLWIAAQVRMISFNAIEWFILSLS